ncbi:hypothetical protein [Streptomyces sp. NPDC047043]|uniref:hypothetical protein n=1 Tax=Streptomyces sp. NPDC047043 TaxID=3154497 RepID=UPI0033E5D8C7
MTRYRSTFPVWRRGDQRGILKSSFQGAAMQRRGKRRRRLALSLSLLALERVLVADRNDHVVSLGRGVPGDGLYEQYVYYCPVPGCALNVTRAWTANAPERAARLCGHPREGRAVFLFRKDAVTVDAAYQLSGAGYYVYICPGRFCQGPAERRAAAVADLWCTSEGHGDDAHRALALAISA